MLKSLLILLALLFVMSKSNAQQYFQADSQTIKTELLARQYTFDAYNLDSLKLIDSTLIFHNSAHFIIRKDRHRIGDTVKSTTLSYYNSLGKDSVEKYLENGIIKSITTTSYDSLGRIVETRTKRMNEPLNLVKEILLIHVPKDGGATDFGPERLAVTKEEYDFFIKYNLTEATGKKDSAYFMIITSIKNVANQPSSKTHRYYDTVRDGRNVVLIDNFNQDYFMNTTYYSDKGMDYKETQGFEVKQFDSILLKETYDRCFNKKVLKIPKPNSIVDIKQMAYKIIKSEKVDSRQQMCMGAGTKSELIFETKDKLVQFLFKHPGYIADFSAAEISILIKERY